MSRHNYKWSINELLSLQREYELLRLPIQDIAAKHKRTTQAIIHKLIEEDLFYIHEDEDEYESEDEYYYSSDDTSGDDTSGDDTISVNDDLYDDEEDDTQQKTIWVTYDEEEETITEKKELPEDDVEYIYIHQYVWNVFYNYFFPDKISYRYKLL
jgi:hypothetical protein